MRGSASDPHGEKGKAGVAVLKMTDLAVAMAEAKMSQSELSRRSGVSREQINRLYNRKAARGELATVANVVALAWALNMPIERFAGHLEVMPLGPVTH